MANEHELSSGNIDSETRYLIEKSLRSVRESLRLLSFNGDELYPGQILGLSILHPILSEFRTRVKSLCTKNPADDEPEDVYYNEVVNIFEGALIALRTVTNDLLEEDTASKRDAILLDEFQALFDLFEIPSDHMRLIAAAKLLPYYSYEEIESLLRPEGVRKMLERRGVPAWGHEDKLNFTIERLVAFALDHPHNILQSIEENIIRSYLHDFKFPEGDNFFYSFPKDNYPLQGYSPNAAKDILVAAKTRLDTEKLDHGCKTFFAAMILSFTYDVPGFDMNADFNFQLGQPGITFCDSRIDSASTPATPTDREIHKIIRGSQYIDQSSAVKKPKGFDFNFLQINETWDLDQFLEAIKKAGKVDKVNYMPATIRSFLLAWRYHPTIFPLPIAMLGQLILQKKDGPLYSFPHIPVADIETLLDEGYTFLMPVFQREDGSRKLLLKPLIQSESGVYLPPGLYPVVKLPPSSPAPFS